MKYLIVFILINLAMTAKAQVLKDAHIVYGWFNEAYSKTYNAVINDKPNSNEFTITFSESFNKYRFRYDGKDANGFHEATVIECPPKGRYKKGEKFYFLAFKKAEKCDDMYCMVTFKRDGKSFIASTKSRNGNDWVGFFPHSKNEYFFRFTNSGGEMIITKTPKKGFYKKGESAFLYCLERIN